MSVCLSVCLSVCMSVCLSVSAVCLGVAHWISINDTGKSLGQSVRSGSIFAVIRCDMWIVKWMRYRLTNLPTDQPTDTACYRCKRCFFAPGKGIRCVQETERSKRVSFFISCNFCEIICCFFFLSRQRALSWSKNENRFELVILWGYNRQLTLPHVAQVEP